MTLGTSPLPLASYDLASLPFTHQLTVGSPSMAEWCTPRRGRRGGEPAILVDATGSRTDAISFFSYLFPNLGESGVASMLSEETRYVRITCSKTTADAGTVALVSYRLYEIEGEVVAYVPLIGVDGGMATKAAYGSFADERSWRSRGFGKFLLHLVRQEARSRANGRVWRLELQSSDEMFGWYDRGGFVRHELSVPVGSTDGCRPMRWTPGVVGPAQSAPKLDAYARFLAGASATECGAKGGDSCGGDEGSCEGEQGGSDGTESPSKRSSRRDSGSPLLIERVHPPSSYRVAKFGVDLEERQSKQEGAGNGLFARGRLSKGTVIQYGSLQCPIYASSDDALCFGATVSHLHTVRETKHCIDGSRREGEAPGGAELANQPLDGSVKCKLNLFPTQPGLEHCGVLTEDVEDGEEIYANYGSDGWSFLKSVGLVENSSNKPCTDYIGHWLYQRFADSGLPGGHVRTRMNELFKCTLSNPRDDEMVRAPSESRHRRRL